MMLEIEIIVLNKLIINKFLTNFCIIKSELQINRRNLKKINNQ